MTEDLSLEGRKKWAVYIKTENLMENSPRLNRRELNRLGYPDEAIQRYIDKYNEKKGTDYTLETWGEADELNPDYQINKSFKKLKECYYGIKEILSRYMDMNEYHKSLVASWIIGTYFHKHFTTYPFLFINAMRGSGKTRLLKIIEALSSNGKLTNNITEAVLFRTAGKNTIIIDEIENIGSKEKSTLRELLNSAYKKGNYVERMKKKQGKEGEEQVVERFHMFTPIVMANIWGMEEVLGDRCINMILEKSNNMHKTKLMEDFDTNIAFFEIKRTLSEINVVLCNVVTLKNIYQEWNKYIDSTYKYINTYNNNITYNYIKLHNEEEIIITEENIELFDLINKSDIDGRNLELYFPIFAIAKLIDISILNELLEIASENVQERKNEEFTNSKDVAVIDFISRRDPLEGLISVKELTNIFKGFYDEDDNKLEWLNPHWFGRALKRLGLIINKKRQDRGMKVVLNVPKAIERLKMFKNEETN